MKRTILSLLLLWLCVRPAIASGIVGVSGSDSLPPCVVSLESLFTALRSDIDSEIYRSNVYHRVSYSVIATVRMSSAGARTRISTLIFPFACWQNAISQRLSVCTYMAGPFRMVPGTDNPQWQRNLGPKNVTSLMIITTSL